MADEDPRPTSGLEGFLSNAKAVGAVVVATAGLVVWFYTLIGNRDEAFQTALTALSTATTAKIVEVGTNEARLRSELAKDIEAKYLSKEASRVIEAKSESQVKALDELKRDLKEQMRDLSTDVSRANRSVDRMIELLEKKVPQ